MRLVGRCSAGIDDEKQMIAAVRYQEIVEDAALGIGEKRVSLTPGGERDHIDGDKAFKAKCDVGHISLPRPERDLPHVRDVE